MFLHVYQTWYVFDDLLINTLKFLKHLVLRSENFNIVIGISKNISALNFGAKKNHWNACFWQQHP